jgi:hypothetical protein
MSLCTVDARHETVDELRYAFVRVKVKKIWAGLFYIALATKG